MVLVRRWWHRPRPAPVHQILCQGPLGEEHAARDAVAAVAALVCSEHEQLRAIVAEARARDPEAFTASLIAVAGALAQSLPSSPSSPGSLAWWALRHEAIITGARR